MALHADGPAHHARYILRNGQSKSHPVDIAVIGGLLTAERLEYMPDKFLLHTDTVITEHKIIRTASMLSRFILRDGYLYHAAWRGIFYRITQDVKKHLRKPQAVAQDILMGNLHRMVLKLQSLPLYIRKDERSHLLHQIRQINCLCLQIEIARLDLADIQYLIQHGKELMA